jgi:hypothetical protein
MIIAMLAKNKIVGVVVPPSYFFFDGHRGRKKILHLNFFIYRYKLAPKGQYFLQRDGEQTQNREKGRREG